VLALAVATCLTSCMTPTLSGHPSQAVADARAGRDSPPAPACPQTTLAETSPVSVLFAYDKAELDSLSVAPLRSAVAWLACHPGVTVAIKPDSDGHGADADQNQLAQRRAEVVREALTTHSVPANRIQILPRGANALRSDVFVISAEGRRW
jgi:outer membrane protein OmpA-like peptidoglycan-associated protein